MMSHPPPEIIDLDADKLEALLRRAEAGAFEQEDFSTLRFVLKAYVYLTRLIDKKSTTINRLRKLLFGPRTEKTSQVVGRDGEPAAADAEVPSGVESNGEDSAPTEPPAPSDPPKSSKKKPGHGRNGAKDYPGADRIKIGHASLQPGDPCLDCGAGTVYDMNRPGTLIRVIGRPPLKATIYELQKLRCNLCGKIYTAQTPTTAGPRKYDETATSMVAVLKYGCGFPFYRFEGLQNNAQVPLPTSTQWEIVEAAIPKLQPAYKELTRQSAQGEVLHNDDTTVKILELMESPKNRRTATESKPQRCVVTESAAQGSVVAESAEDTNHEQETSNRKGVFTSGVVATSLGQRIALFFSGQRHAGENLEEVLRRRAADLPPPIQMCDALSRNLPKKLQTIVANCLAHGRRRFVDVNDRFPEETRHVLESLEVVYRNDAVARERKLSPEQRLAFHQAESGPIMEDLYRWLKRQFDDRLVEPNSVLGDAINYMLKRWERLTLFLRKSGAPLDNNICERALKKAILHRKNALFYKTRAGAAAGDLFMSLIHTCELNGANPFDYLTELLRHAAELAADPAKWMPWNYRDNLAAA